MPTFIVKQSRYFARCATMWLVLMAVGSAFADNSKISPDLLPLLSNPTNTVNVIVQYNTTPPQHQQTCSRGGVQYDDFGHGPHVAGILAGNGSSSSMPGSLHILKGIAPNANLLDLRVLDKNGASTDSAVIAAIQQAVQLKSKYNVRVINLSLGRPIYESCNRDPLCQAVEAAWRNGIVVVTAAGNLGRNGYATVLCPGNSPPAISVGCMKTLETSQRTDHLSAPYSSRGPTYIDLTVKPDLVAPGNLVVSLLAPGSTLATQYPANLVAPSYYTTSKTPGPVQYFRF